MTLSGSDRPIRLVIVSEGGEVIELHVEGSLTIPRTRIKRISLWGILNVAQALESDRAGDVRAAGFRW